MFQVSSLALRKGRRTLSKAEEYLDRSKTFAAAAEAAADPRRKVTLLEIAQHWAHLAEVAERNAMLPGCHSHDNRAR
jgi:hypothetical protein